LKKFVFLTGQAGIGKTTVLKKIIESLRKEGFMVGGLKTDEIREKGSRIGFEITNVLTGRKGTLAHVSRVEGPKFGKYRVNLRDLIDVGVGALKQAAEKAEVIVIDEVGPMELLSCEFKRAVRKAVNSGKPLVGTIHYNARDPLIDTIRLSKDVTIIEVTRENRDDLHVTVVKKIHNP